MPDEQERLRTIHDLDAAALQLREACAVLLDDACRDAKLRSTVFARVSKQSLAEAVALVGTLARPPDDDNHAEQMEQYRRIRRFWPHVLRTVPFQAAPAGQPVVNALNFLADIEGEHQPDLSRAPLDHIPRSWRREVIGPDRTIDRRAYTVCVLERLQDSLRRRDVFVRPSVRWGDPRVKLLQGSAWESARPHVCRILGREATAAAEMEALTRRLDETYRRTAANLPTNTAVRIEIRRRTRDHDADRPGQTGRTGQPDRRSAKQWRPCSPASTCPKSSWRSRPGPASPSEFTHISEGAARVTDLTVSLCAVLLAEACNIGLEPLVRPDIPALTRGRLAWVQQNYIRAETLIRANARLVDAQAKIPLAQAWGGGEVASADGLRFVVPVRTVNAGPNSKYFGTGRGITYYNFTSDQFTGFHGIVIPGTLRDSLFILEGLVGATDEPATPAR